MNQFWYLNRLVIPKDRNGTFLFIFICVCGGFFLLWYFALSNFQIDSKTTSIIFDQRTIEQSNENSSKPINNIVSRLIISDINPKELLENNYNISFVDYLDGNFSKDCGTPVGRDQLFILMKFWINFTATHDIPWWLVYGSLIGSLRHKDMVPWDSDIDLGIPSQFESVIRKFSTSRSNLSNKNVNIVTRPGPHCPYNGPRMDCRGNPVTSQVDGCAFCGPLARVFFDSWKRIDIYLFHIQIHENELKVMDEGIFEYTDIPPRFPFDWYFPLRTCSFMGLSVLCPIKTETVLINHYQSYKSLYKCEKTKWKKIS